MLTIFFVALAFFAGAATATWISPGQLAESMDLRRNTALEGCTNIDGDDAGMFIAKRWPRLSSGEEALWACLAWLNGHSERPTDDVLRDVLDDANYAAVAGVAQ